MTSLETEFWENVERRGYNECWPWIKPTQGGGYGQFRVPAGELEVPADFRTPGGRTYKQVIAPRVAFRLFHGRWPEPCSLHGCDNPPCCNAENPEHVHEGTHSLNSQEMYARGRGPVHMRGGELHCRAKLSAAQVEEIRVRFAAGGLTQAQLAAEYGIRQGTVSKYVRGLRFSSAEHQPLSVAHRRYASVPEEVRTTIRAMCAAGVSQQQVADQFGIGQTSVSRIVRE